MIYANMQDTKKPRVQELINQRITFFELYSECSYAGFSRRRSLSHKTYRCLFCVLLYRNLRSRVPDCSNWPT